MIFPEVFNRYSEDPLEKFVLSYYVPISRPERPRISRVRRDAFA
jgi:hypothetical protein